MRDFTWEAPEVPEGDGRRYHFSQEYLKPLERQKTISTIAMTVGCPRYLPLFIFTQSLRFQPGTGWCDSVCRCLQRVSHHLLQGAPCPAGIPKVYYEFSEDGLIQSDGQKPVFYPWKDIRILYQVGDDFQGGRLWHHQWNFIITDYIERKTKIVERIVAHVKDHAQIDGQDF